MHPAELPSRILKKRTFLCVGLDSDIQRIPKHLLPGKNPLLEFNKKIIEATLPFAVAYKINTAFYEALGSLGWEVMRKTLDYIPEKVFTIADAKRGDIGNTSDKYAEAFFRELNFDAVTLSPYMGFDAVSSFLKYDNKATIILGLTSNSSAADFQFHGDPPLYERVFQLGKEWGSPSKIMFVAGATRPELLKHIRTIIPDHFLLVPGVGVQGGSLKSVCENGMNKNTGILVNSSRGIIFASPDEDFSKSAANVAKVLQEQMAGFLD